MIYDEESMVKDVVALLQSKLNTEIVAINNEKNDTLVLEQITSNKYLFETIDNRVLNYKGFFVIYGINPTPVKESSSGNLIEDVIITINIGTIDSGEKERSNILYKLLRYRRALKKLFLDNPDVFRGYAKSSVKSLRPDAFDFGNNVIILTTGVDVTASVTAI